MSIVMWMFRLVHAFVPALLILLLTILLKVAPREIALSGFTSEAFFLCLGIFIMAAQIFSSGLLTRFSLILLRILPRTRFSQNLVLFVNGGLLSMVLPSPVGRAALLTPLAFDMIEDTPKVREKKIDVSALIVSLTQGSTLLSVVFLTGNPLNLIMLDLADKKTRTLYGQWANWFAPAEIAALILILGWLLVMLWLTIKSDLQPVNKEKIKKKLVEMGSITYHEVGSLIALVAFIAGALTVQYHQIPLAWIAFGIALVLFLYDAASPQDLRNNVDWPTILFIASLTSWQPIMAYLRLDQTLVNVLQASFKSLNLASYIDLRFNQIPILIIALAIGIGLLRFILPGGPAFVILMTALAPIVTDAGISPWILGFSLLTISEGFILPYQHGAYTQALSELESRGLLACYRPKKLLVANIFLVITRVAAVCVSFWYWRSISAI